jgi:hypothetical protein
LHSPPENLIALSVFSSPFCLTFLRAKKQDPNKKQRKKAQIVVMTNKTFTVARQCFGVHKVGKKKKQQQQQERETQGRGRHLRCCNNQTKPNPG